LKQSSSEFEEAISQLHMQQQGTPHCPNAGVELKGWNLKWRLWHRLFANKAAKVKFASKAPS
jgi:hypothetical protein